MNVLPVYAQSVNHVWSKKAGGTADGKGVSIAVDAAGNSYVTGTFAGTVDFDPGPGVVNLSSAGGTSQSGSDVFVMKLDPTGNLAWVKGFGGIEMDEPKSVALDASGNILVAGNFRNTVDFDPGPAANNVTSNGAADMYILKLDATGGFLWVKTIGGSGGTTFFPDVWLSSMCLDVNGNVYASGYLSTTNVDFDPGPGTALLSSVGSWDAFILKIDAGGNFQWARSIGGAVYDQGVALTTDALGNVIITGTFDGTVDFDPGTAVENYTAVGGNDIFISKYDASGNYLWTKHISGYGTAYAIKTDAAGNIYTTGIYLQATDFDPGPSVYTLYGGQALYGLFVSKLDASGNFVWAKGPGVDVDIQGTSLQIDGSGGLYVSGYFTGTVDFDPGPNIFNLIGDPNMFNGNGFILKLDVSGNFIWVRNTPKSLSQSDFSVTRAIALDGSGNIYGTGSFNGTADFDPGINQSSLSSSATSPFTDVFVQKLNQNTCLAPSLTQVNLIECDSFTMAGNTYTTTGFYSHVFSNQAGCDSIVNVNLTVNYSSASSHTHTSCDSFGFNGNMYTTSGIHLDTFVNAVGCDSVVSLNLTLLHSPFDTLTQSSCDSFVLNGTSYYSTGFHIQNYTSATGCDSVVVLDLTILNSLDTIPQTSCHVFVYNGNTYSSSGFYSNSFTSVNNCDSIVVLDLTINTVDISVTNTGAALSAGAAGATYQWLDCNGFFPLSGETSQNFVFAQSGSYAVAVTQNGCTDTSVCIVVTGVEDLNRTQGIKLYPNPSDGSLTIEVDYELNHAVIRVIDIRGRIVQSMEKVRGPEVFLDLQSLPPGMYVIEIIDRADIVRAKFSKL